MKMITQMIEDELYEATTTDGIKTRVDMRALPHKQHQSPVELLLSSVSACGAVDIVMMLKKRRKKIEKFTIEVEGTRRENPPRAFTSIQFKYTIVSEDVGEEELYKTAKLSLEKYCSVAASLNAVISFSVAVVRPG